MQKHGYYGIKKHDTVLYKWNLLRVELKCSHHIKNK